MDPFFRRHSPVSSTRLPFHWTKTVRGHQDGRIPKMNLIVSRSSSSANRSHITTCYTKTLLIVNAGHMPVTQPGWLKTLAETTNAIPHSLPEWNNPIRGFQPRQHTFETYAGRSSDFILRFLRNPFPNSNLQLLTRPRSCISLSWLFVILCADSPPQT